jgi:acyl-CoA hydrolase
MANPFAVLSADEAARLIQHGQNIGFSGFTAAGAAKAIPLALAGRAEREHAAERPFQVGVLTGASTGHSLDGALAKAQAISFRTPYQSDPACARRSTRVPCALWICTSPCCRRWCVMAPWGRFTGQW